MGQNIEIEFKNLLYKEEFNKIAGKFSLGQSDFKHQVNHYFDTDSFDLKKAGSALRIREKGGSYILTLKQPYGDGLLETDQRLTLEEATDAIQGGCLPAGEVKHEVEKLGIQFNGLAYFGTLETSRAEVEYQGGLLVLDHSRYLDTEDYELEFEAEEFDIGRRTFTSLLEKLGIPKRETPNKIRRFYTRKLVLQDEKDK
ncbi:CYTH domain-containing protein [Bacillus sp. FJAT-27225]|uniref:CYTH domain-containing protein n=1 Tax=Bacillus sp. FJAT-27225 TaxID=1743144 RepID=UPI00080C2A08|nr:CYTH domain-containing protein [Bacillus sp. FJAT-27225]OCA84543.1 CYTH domain-containing protein [Bacillus sp. FJAT-27225]